jgi:hypothetical protein
MRQEEDNNTNYQQQEIQVKSPEIKPLPKFDSLAKTSDQKDLLNINEIVYISRNESRQ